MQTHFLWQRGDVAVHNTDASHIVWRLDFGVPD